MIKRFRQRWLAILVPGNRVMCGLVLVSVAIILSAGCDGSAKQSEGVRGLRPFTVGNEEIRVYAWLIEKDDKTVFQGPMFAARRDVRFKFIRDYEHDCFVIANTATTNSHNIKSHGVFHLKPDGAMVLIHDAWPGDIFRKETVENQFIEEVIAVELRKTSP